MKKQKKYWLREDLRCADEFTALIPKLRDEFLEYHYDFVDGDYKKAIFVSDTLPNSKYVLNNPDAWKSEPMKYEYAKENIYQNMYESERAKNFPTAVALTKKWGTDCAITSYSVLEKDAHLFRHTGKENRDNKFIRIHVPLIVPEGDIGFECEGVEISWADIWGFNNQLAHSAWNNSGKRRLVFIIDIRRQAIGLPDEPPYDPDREAQMPPFQRGELPRVYHTCELDQMSLEDQQKALLAMKQVN
jgi:hypothetical protein